MKNLFVNNGFDTEVKFVGYITYVSSLICSVGGYEAVINFERPDATYEDVQEGRVPGIDMFVPYDTIGLDELCKEELKQGDIVMVCCYHDVEDCQIESYKAKSIRKINIKETRKLVAMLKKMGAWDEDSNR